MATEVAIAFALSWKPLVKSKNSAVTITTATRNNVLVMAEVTYLRIARRVCPVGLVTCGAGWCVDAEGISALGCPPGTEWTGLMCYSGDRGHLRSPRELMGFTRNAGAVSGVLLDFRVGPTWSAMNRPRPTNSTMALSTGSLRILEEPTRFG